MMQFQRSAVFAHKFHVTASSPAAARQFETQLKQSECFFAINVDGCVTVFHTFDAKAGLDAIAGVVPESAVVPEPVANDFLDSNRLAAEEEEYVSDEVIDYSKVSSDNGS